MAEHNLFLGGGKTFNPDWAMFPSLAVTASQQVDAATHKGAQVTWLNRILDPTKDDALKAYLKAVPTADDANEVWNVAIVPQGVILLGHYYRIVTPVTGLTFTTRLKNISTAGTTNISAAVNGGVVGEAYVNAGAGLVGLTPFNQYLQFVPTVVPGGGILDMRIEVASLFIVPFHGQW